MVLLAVIGGLLLSLALILRELMLARERASYAAEQEQLRSALDDTRAHLRRAVEDLHVLQAVLEEKRVVDETELARGRLQHVETPRRVAAERDTLARNLNVSPMQLVIDDDMNKVH